MPRPLAWLAHFAMFALCPIVGACTDTSTDTGTSDSQDGTDSPSGAFVSLIDHQAWVAVEADADPLADHRPEMVECSAAGWRIESTGLEIDTNFCNYLALAQPSLGPLTQGEAVELDFYHFDLTAPEPAEAHLALLVDGQALWQTVVTIPGDAQVHKEELLAPFDAPAGAQLIIHLHNHGQNTWVLQDLRAWVP